MLSAVVAVVAGRRRRGIARCVQAAMPQRTPADEKKLQNSSALTVTHGRPVAGAAAAEQQEQLQQQKLQHTAMSSCTKTPVAAAAAALLPTFRIRIWVQMQL
jgi:hypothetical protein